MIKCSKCGEECDTRDIFCLHCGNPMMGDPGGDEPPPEEVETTQIITKPPPLKKGPVSDRPAMALKKDKPGPASPIKMAKQPEKKPEVEKELEGAAIAAPAEKAGQKMDDTAALDPTESPEGSLPLPQERLCAAALDIGLVLAIFFPTGIFCWGLFFIPYIGRFLFWPAFGLLHLIFALYILVRDCEFMEFRISRSFIDFGGIQGLDGRSLGKMVRKIEAVSENGQKLTWQKSFIRNLPLAIGMIATGILCPLMIIPIVGGILFSLGMVLTSFIQLVLIIVECYLIFKAPDGKRLGDKYAGSKSQFRA
ncbi:RDD family protein [Candidatus Riflebacteria bacterium]